MPRRAVFIPTKTKDPKRGIPRRLPWVLNIPPALSETGKRQQKFFATQREAQTAAEQLKIRKDNFGITLSLLSAARISEAAQAYQILDELTGLGEPDTTLLTVVRQYAEQRARARASVTFYQLFLEYAGAHSRVTRSHLKKLENARDRFPRVKEKPASEIQPGDLEPILNALPPAMRNAQMRYLKAVFNFGIKRGWVLHNPIERLDFVHLKAKEVETVPFAVVKKMLEGALANYLELVPFLTLGFFCGIRPKGELERLEWRSIDLKDKVIVIAPSVSKTHRRRFVDLSDNAVAWLNAYIAKGGSTTGKVVTLSFGVLRAKRRTNWTAAAGENVKWPQQGMRHTFCSNWLTMHGDVNKLVLQSGHDSVDTMWRNYHRGTRKEDAKEFWAIVPPSDPAADKIVAFVS